MRLRDKVAIITGATSGIGRASAVLFCREGAKVVVVGRRKDKGEETLALIREATSEAIYVQADVTSRQDVNSMVEATVDRFERVDILFNNAGVSPAEGRTPVADCPERAWDQVMDVNLKSIYRCSRKVIPLMVLRGGGVIINMSSMYGFVGFPDRAAYIASKGAVSQLTKSMAVDYGPHNIRVNCLCPGLVANDRVQLMLRKAQKDGELDKILADYPLGRVGTPEDVAQAAVFLASDEASWITGAAIPVDGGYTAR